MNEIPLNYATAYNWTGDDGKGEIRIGDLPVHHTMQIVTARSTFWSSRRKHAWRIMCC